MIQLRLPALLPLLAILVSGSCIQAKSLKAVTWNLEWFPGGRPNAYEGEKVNQMNGVKAKLQKLAPDIFLAQELTEKKAFARLVATVPGLKVNVFSKFVEPDGKTPSPQQCGIASNLKVNSAWFESFKVTETMPNPRRGFAFAALEHPEGGLIMLYCVHLKSNRGSETSNGEKDVANIRVESAKQLIAHKAAMEEKFAKAKILGWMIAGDFNTNHDGQFHRCTVIRDLVTAGFHNTWNATPKARRLTWRNDPRTTDFKPTTFDYMMTSGFKERQAKLSAASPKLSDHNPVTLMLEVP